jgi:proline iminopeptidase
MTPDEFTILETFIDVGDNHQLYLQDWGNPKAKNPIIFLHGGPGSGVNNKHRQRFNPYEQRVIFFDQRGCGKSLPYGSLSDNTTDNLVDDIELIAQHRGLEKFVITGGSWGSTLALAYALKYPDRVIAMTLAGIFTGSQAEIDYLDKGDYRVFFPDVWDHYLSQTPKSHQADPTKYHFDRILGDDINALRSSAYLYSNLESSLMSLDDRFTAQEVTDFDAIPTRIEVHYLANHCFMPDRYILDNAHKLTMPIWLVQGRYDVVCPPKIAYELHAKILNSTLIWTMAGHGNDRSNYDVIRTINSTWN